jgi:hypothetical protein
MDHYTLQYGLLYAITNYVSAQQTLCHVKDVIWTTDDFDTILEKFCLCVTNILKTTGSVVTIF